MALYELYIGGPSTANAGRSMFPAVAFDEAAKPFTQISMAAHKGPIGFADKRCMDFGADHALQEFVRKTPAAQGDIIGACIIPKNNLFMGFYYKVVTPQAGLTLTPRLRGKATAFTAINCATVAEGFVEPGGGAIITEGPVTMDGVQYDNKPDILDFTLTAFPAGGFGRLKLIITPILLTVDQGGGP